MLVRAARHTATTFSPRKPTRIPLAARRFNSTMSFNAKQFVQDSINNNQVFIFSKSWCPYCRKVKSLFNDINVKFGVVELDQFENGDAVQAALSDLTKQRTVPNVFIGGKHVGGSDDTHRKKNSGELKKLLQDAGVTDAKL